jgi:hypothetical protein
MADEGTKSGGAPAAAIRTYPEGIPFTGVIGRAVADSVPAWPVPKLRPRSRPTFFG